MSICQFVEASEPGVFVCKECGVPTPAGRKYDNPPVRPCPAVQSRAHRSPQRSQHKPSHRHCGPGCQLHQILEAWGFRETPGCGCKSFAKKMDKWGVDGCEARLDSDIVPWIVKQFDDRRKKPKGLSVTAKHLVRVTPRAAVPVIAKRLVKKAIRAAKKSIADYKHLRDEDPRRYITTKQLVADTNRVVPFLPPDITAVAGSARSGMMPAAIIATAMHVPLLAVDPHRVVECGHGWRLRQHTPPAQQKILIVEDSVFKGRTIKECVKRIRKEYPQAEALTCAIYCHPSQLHTVDFPVVGIGPPHYFEWNFWNSYQIELSGFDMDGVLCGDIAPNNDDDGPAYVAAIRNAQPLHYVRRAKIPLIVTARLEKYRKETEEWLARHGIEVENLVMFPGDVNDRGAPKAISSFKAKHYKASKLQLFVESCPIQAKEIHRITGKPVLCPAAGVAFRQ